METKFIFIFLLANFYIWRISLSCISLCFITSHFIYNAYIQCCSSFSFFITSFCSSFGVLCNIGAFNALYCLVWVLRNYLRYLVWLKILFYTPSTEFTSFFFQLYLALRICVCCVNSVHILTTHLVNIKNLNLKMENALVMYVLLLLLRNNARQQITNKRTHKSVYIFLTLFRWLLYIYVEYIVHFWIFLASRYSNIQKYPLVKIFNIENRNMALGVVVPFSL